MMPILHCPGVMMPGQLGPISRVRECRTVRQARAMSIAGMPSVMHTTSGSSASQASRMASAANGGGTKITETLALVAATACRTVSYTGVPSWLVPPLPGVTPATTWVPYSRHMRAWKLPSRPVMPWTSSRVFLSTRMAMALPGGGDDLLRRVLHVVGHRDLEAAGGQDLPPLGHVGAFHADHQRQLQLHRPRRLDHPGGQRVAAQDAAEDVDQHRLHRRVFQQDLEGVPHLLAVRSAAHVEEVGGRSAGILNDVHGRHRQPGAVDHAGHVALELDVVQPVLAGLDLERRLLVQVAQLFQLRMPVQRVVVQVDLGVERHQRVFRGQDQRVDLGQRAVERHVGARQAGHDLDRAVQRSRRQAQAKGELAGLVSFEAGIGVERGLQDRGRVLGRDLFDLHAARRRGHEHRLARPAVQHDAQVQLAGNVRRLFDQDLAHLAPLRAGLVGHQGHAQDLARTFDRFFGRFGQLDAAALAASARVDLGFHHRASAEFGGSRGRVFRLRDHPPARNRHAEAAQQLLGLVFMDFHRENSQDSIDDMQFSLESSYRPQGDQPGAIAALTTGVRAGEAAQVLLGVTGSGKTYTMAKVIAELGRPALVMAHNKTLAAQLYHEFKTFFPRNAVEYFVSYYDYYQPEAYVPAADLYIEKEATINDELDKLRLSATRSLFEQRDCIIVSSVSCIYGLGSPEAYYGMLLFLEKGQKISRQEILRKLVEILYERNDTDFRRGTFRVRGDVIEVFPTYDDNAYRIELWGDEVESLSQIDPLFGTVKQRYVRLPIYPKSHYVMKPEKKSAAVESILQELSWWEVELEKQGRVVEANRIHQRTMFDLEMIKAMGFCHGIENYSRHFTGRMP